MEARLRIPPTESPNFSPVAISRLLPLCLKRTNGGVFVRSDIRICGMAKDQDKDQDLNRGRGGHIAGDQFRLVVTLLTLPPSIATPRVALKQTSPLYGEAKTLMAIE